MSRGRLTNTERSETIRIMRNHPDWTTTTQETHITDRLATLLPGYTPRGRGAYRRWFNNYRRQHRLPPPPPPTSEEVQNEYFFTSDEETDVEDVDVDDDDEDEDQRQTSNTPIPSLKRTLSNCHTKEELEREMKKLRETFKRRKEELEREETAFPECPVCFDTIDNDSPLQAVLASCGHVFCAQCYMRQCSTTLMRYSQRCHQCPMCRSNWDKPSKVHIMPKGATVAMCKQKANDHIINLT